jgi:T5orf172 domain
LEHVYVVGRDGSPFVKIGWTRKTAAERMQTIKPIDGGPLEVFAAWGMDFGARLVEQDIHIQLAVYRHTGEWFRCTVDEVAIAYHTAFARKLLPPPPHLFCEIIRERRLECGMTQEGLALCAALPLESVERYEAGHPDVPFRAVIAMAYAIGIRGLALCQPQGRMGVQIRAFMTPPWP